MFTTTYLGCTSTILVRIRSFVAKKLIKISKRDLLTRLIEASVARKLVEILEHRNNQITSDTRGSYAHNF